MAPLGGGRDAFHLFGSTPLPAIPDLLASHTHAGSGGNGHTCCLSLRQICGIIEGMPPSASPPARAQATPAALFKTWLFPAIVALLAMRLAFVYLLPEGATRASSQQAQRNQVLCYFYNEATGQVQWEDPGDMPHEDESGMRYWYLPDGSKSTSDPSVGRYAW
jgi:hypothetical protein